MANTVSSLKRARQTITKTAINRANKTKLRNTLRALREAIAAGDKKGLIELYRTTVSVLDKSVQKGVLHKNTASRYKGRLNARVKADIVFFETPQGGAVFATGSICFIASLAHHGYENSVSQLTRNAVLRFLDETPFTLP